MGKHIKKISKPHDKKCGCNECQSSCQTACKTSATVSFQACEKA